MLANDIRKKGTRSFRGSVRRKSLISVGVVGKQKKTKSGSGGFIGVGSGGGGSPVCIPPVPTALCCASQVSLMVPFSRNVASGQHSTSSHTSIADLRRAALSSPNGGGELYCYLGYCYTC